MTQTDIQQLFEEMLKNLHDANAWLIRSYTRCQQIGIKPNYVPDEFDDFENLTSRFARVCDFVINKIFRCLDKLEFAPEGTLLDTINRAAKRNLIESTELARKIKELRNELAHEYSHRELQNIFKDVLEYTPILLEWVNNIENYYKEKYQS